MFATSYKVAIMKKTANITEAIAQLKKIIENE